MDLTKKKALAAKTLGVGKGRIKFVEGKLDEIKEAITKQDIRDLVANGSIMIREIKGRRAIVKRKTRRRMGSIRKRIGNRKVKYIMLTRRLRNYVSEIFKQEKISKEVADKLRKEIKAKDFRDKVHLKERVEALK